MLDLSSNGQTILFFEGEIGTGNMFVIENARNKNQLITQIMFKFTIGSYPKISEDGNCIYFDRSDYSSPTPNLYLYSHLENGTWSIPVPCVVNGYGYLSGAQDMNSDGSLLCSGSLFVERVGDKFSIKHKIDTHGGGFTGQTLSKDGKTIIYSIDGEKDIQTPAFYLRHLKPMLYRTGLYYAEFDDQNIYPIKTVKIDDGYWTQFHYSKSTNRLIWTALKDNPYPDNGPVNGWDQY